MWLNYLNPLDNITHLWHGGCGAEGLKTEALSTESITGQGGICAI